MLTLEKSLILGLVLGLISFCAVGIVLEQKQEKDIFCWLNEEQPILMMQQVKNVRQNANTIVANTKDGGYLYHNKIAGEVCLIIPTVIVKLGDNKNNNANATINGGDLSASQRTGLRLFRGPSRSR